MGIYAAIAWRQLKDFLRPVWRWRPSQRTAVLGGSLLMIAMIIAGATLFDDVMVNIETRNRLYQETEPGDVKAPELPDSLVWLGKKGEYGDKVTALFFWNPSCVTCIKAYRQKSIWEERYKSYGLKIISVMSARYDFETDPEYTVQFMDKHNIKLPAAYDVEYELEDAISDASDTFQLSRDSVIVLIDKDKNIRHVDPDAGSMYNTELVIQGLLNEAGVDEQLPPPAGSRQDATMITTALYFGDFDDTIKTFIGEPDFNLRQTNYGSEDGMQLSSIGDWGLNGTWRGGKSYITSISSGYLATLFTGTKVYIVAESPKPDYIGVTVNDKIMARAEDVDKDGLIKINKPGIYQLVDSDKPIKNAKLTLSLADNIKIYSLMVLSD